MTPKHGRGPELSPALASLIERLSARKEWCAGDAVRVLRDCHLTPDDIEGWSAFDHAAADSYGRRRVYSGPHLEVMVMSWNPGDFSAIHDHGHAHWGAVQVFGPAEQATFRVAEERLVTLARGRLEEGDVIGVGPSLIHQMGNPTADQPFVSLHAYGSGADTPSVTGESRIYDLERGTIQRVDGGVFFELGPTEILREEPGVDGDFPARLRHMVELVRRLDTIKAARLPTRDSESVYEDAFSSRHRTALLESLRRNTDEGGQPTNSPWWRSLAAETRAAAALQGQREAGEGSADSLLHRAELHDELIGKPCLDAFVRRYLRFVTQEYALDWGSIDVLSLGCRTGLVEEFIIAGLGARPEALFGIDGSPSMVDVAKKRIQAERGDILALGSDSRRYGLVFGGLNVFHDVESERLGEALAAAASVLSTGGHFVADFMTPDPIRSCAHAVYSADKRVVSLRTPSLVEDAGHRIQESEITTLSFLDERMRISYAAKIRRFLPSMQRVRRYITQAFGAAPTFHDASSLAVVPPGADTCESTRYVAVVQKGR